MAKFHPLTVKDIYKDTDDCSVIEFSVPEDLKNIFKFKTGQYLTLRETINDEDIRRSYSLCSSPFDNEWKVDLYASTKRNDKVRRSRKLKKQRKEEQEFYDKLHGKSFKVPANYKKEK